MTRAARCPFDLRHMLSLVKAERKIARFSSNTKQTARRNNYFAKRHQNSASRIAIPNPSIPVAGVFPNNVGHVIARHSKRIPHSRRGILFHFCEPLAQQKGRHTRTGFAKTSCIFSYDRKKIGLTPEPVPFRELLSHFAEEGGATGASADQPRCCVSRNLSQIAVGSSRDAAAVLLPARLRTAAATNSCNSRAPDVHGIHRIFVHDASAANFAGSNCADKCERSNAKYRRGNDFNIKHERNSELRTLGVNGI